jgi:hypothetical protein
MRKVLTMFQGISVPPFSKVEKCLENGSSCLFQNVGNDLPDYVIVIFKYTHSMMTLAMRNLEMKRKIVENIVL